MHCNVFFVLPVSYEELGKEKTSLHLIFSVLQCHFCDWRYQEQSQSQNSNSFTKHFTLSSFGTLFKQLKHNCCWPREFRCWSREITCSIKYANKIHYSIIIIGSIIQTQITKIHFKLYLIFTSPRNHKKAGVGRLHRRSPVTALLGKAEWSIAGCSCWVF